MTDSKEWCDGDWRCRSSSKPFAGAESGSPGRVLEAGKRGSPGRPVQAGIRGKRLNPPGVGWVKIFIFFKVRVSIRTCVQNLDAIRRERFLTIYNPLNPPPRGGVGQFFF